jgi:hypothetical protein
MNRLLRMVALGAAWYLLVFTVAGSAWAQLVRSPMPPGLDLVRLGLWCWWCARGFPGDRRFVGEGPGTLTTAEIVPEAPTAPLVGWRAWRIGERIRWDGGSDWETRPALTSLVVPEVWPKSEPMRALCFTSTSHARQAPAAYCHCGIYAVADPQCAHVFSRIGRRQVYGPVLTWGRTQVHERGWRSEFARPLALVRPRILRPRLRQELNLLLNELGVEYAVPVLSLKQAKALASRMAERTPTEGAE